MKEHKVTNKIDKKKVENKRVERREIDETK
jgi:hypothetical protein